MLIASISSLSSRWCRLVFAHSCLIGVLVVFSIIPSRLVSNIGSHDYLPCPPPWASPVLPRLQGTLLWSSSELEEEEEEEDINESMKEPLGPVTLVKDEILWFERELGVVCVFTHTPSGFLVHIGKWATFAFFSYSLLAASAAAVWLLRVQFCFFTAHC